MVATACRGCGSLFVDLTKHLAKGKAERNGCGAHYAHASIHKEKESHPVVLDHARRERLALVSDGLGDLRFEKALADSTISAIKDYTSRWNEAGKTGAAEELCALHPNLSSVTVAAILDRNLDHFNNLKTEKQELSYMRSIFPTVPVVERDVGGGHVVCDIPLLDSVERFLKNETAEKVERIIDASERMKSGAYLDDTDVLNDFYHGLLFRQHAAAQPLNDPLLLRVLIGGYTDGCEMANGMGPAAGEHELWCTTASILNLPPAERFEHDNVLLMNVATNKAVHHATMTAIFSGADPNTGAILPNSESSPGGQLREQRREVVLMYHGKLTKFVMVVYLFWFSADNPAAGKMTSFPESTAAHLPCRGCTGDQREDAIKRPHNFFACSAGRRLHNRAAE